MGIAAAALGCGMVTAMESAQRRREIDFENRVEHEPFDAGLALWWMEIEQWNADFDRECAAFSEYLETQNLRDKSR